MKIKGVSKIPVKVEKIFTAEDVQKAAIKKYSEIDQYFCHLDMFYVFQFRKLLNISQGQVKFLMLKNINNFYQSLTQK